MEGFKRGPLKRKQIQKSKQIHPFLEKCLNMPRMLLICSLGNEMKYESIYVVILFRFFSVQHSQMTFSFLSVNVRNCDRKTGKRVAPLTSPLVVGLLSLDRTRRPLASGGWYMVEHVEVDKVESR